MKTIEWVNGRLRMIDQTRLPTELRFVDCLGWEDVADAIRGLKIRGAPAIGVAAAFGLALAARQAPGDDHETFWRFVDRAAAVLRASRPTAVNLGWALDVVLNSCDRSAPPNEVCQRFVDLAQSIADDDVQACRRLGDFGADLIPDGANVLTHCNTGSLATVEHGTALGMIRSARARGKTIHVWVDETRPVLQGARLTAWELLSESVPHTVIVDSAAAYLMRRGRVTLVVVGADRIAANGDAANKIGTYGLAVLARSHGIPFYVAAPTSTIDLTVATGDDIPIEERNPDEVKRIGDKQIVPNDSPALNLAFDVTPSSYIDAIVTEWGIARAPYNESIEPLVIKGGKSRVFVKEAARLA